MQQRGAGDDAATVPVAGGRDRTAGAGRAARHPGRLRPGDHRAARPLRARTCSSATTSACGAPATTSRYSDPPDATVDALATRAGQLLPLAGRRLRPRLRRVQRPRRRLQPVRATATAAPPGGTPPTSAGMARFLARLRRGRRASGVVMWQIPLGNTQDAGDEQHLGPLPGQPGRVAPRRPGPRPSQRSTSRPACVAFLFGGGAAGTTCACDANGGRGDQSGADQRQHGPVARSPTTTAASSARRPRRITARARRHSPRPASPGS